MNETYLSYINGNNAGNVAPEEVLVQARSFLRQYPLPNSIADISENQAIAFAFLHNEFIKREPVIINHECWHGEFGSGGTLGAGSGEEFLIFHRQMMKDLKHFIGSDHLPVWEPGTAVYSVATTFPLPNGTSLSPAFPSSDEGFLEIPSFLTVEGIQGGEEPFIFEEKEIRSLSDIENIDDLGRIIGTQFHGVGHGLLGGTMNTFASPLVAQVYAWHGEIDKLIDQWEQTIAGREWFDSRDSKEWKDAEEFFNEEFYQHGKNFTTYCNMTDFLPGFNFTQNPSLNFTQSSNNSRISDGDIIGITVGGAVFTAATIFACVFGKKIIQTK